MIALDVAQESKKYQFYLMGAPHLSAQHGIFRFFDRNAELFNLDRVSDLNSLLAKHPSDKDLYFIVLPHRISDLTYLRERFHTAIVEKHLDLAGQLVYVGFMVSHLERH